MYFELQSFTAKVERGSSVKLTWVIDDLEKFTHEGESYSVVFKKPSEHKLKVTLEFTISFHNFYIQWIYR